MVRYMPIKQEELDNLAQLPQVKCECHCRRQPQAYGLPCPICKGTGAYVRDMTMYEAHRFLYNMIRDRVTVSEVESILDQRDLNRRG